MEGKIAVRHIVDVHPEELGSGNDLLLGEKGDALLLEPHHGGGIDPHIDSSGYRR
jgi:hypothetical protein